MTGDPLQTFAAGQPIGSLRADTANAWSVNNARAGGKMNLGGNDVYTVQTVTDDTTITLEERFMASDVKPSPAVR